MEPSLLQILDLARISAAVALREEEVLRQELQKAIRHDNVSIVWVREAILQSYLFAGYAAAINAFIVLNDLVGDDPAFFREEEASLEIWRKRGEELCRIIYGEQYDRLLANIKRLHPDLAEWMIREGYGKVLSRPFLSLRLRELLIVAMTAVLNTERQFYSHVRGAIHVGASAEDLRAVLKEVAHWMNPATLPRFEKILEDLLSPSRLECP